MKKLIAALTLLLAFSINANAQAKKASTSTSTELAKKDAKPLNSHDQAKKDADDLTALLKLNPTQNQDFFNLFEMKYKMLEDKTLSVERKKALSSSIEAKIRASLDANQTDKLEKNKELFNRLIN